MNFLAFLILSFSAQALASNSIGLKLAGMQYVFLPSTENTFIYCRHQSKSCEAKSALVGLKPVTQKQLADGQKMASSVGSSACTVMLKGRSVLATLANGDQRAICILKDNSMIEINSLSTAIVKKKLLID
jgi:hypothetical protein